MFKVDFHTHSSASPDGGITPAQYVKALSSGLLDIIAITDHNETKLAKALHEELGDKIIVGEEIMSTEGEIIGLYLQDTIPAGLSAEETIQQIKAQGGIVYIPHPFETMRKGLSASALDRLAATIDIIEVCNGRAFAQNRGGQAVVWARLNSIVGGASSDAHGIAGLGKTFSSLPELPTKETLVELLSRSTHHTKRPSARALLYPKYHRIRKRIKK